MSTAIVLSGGGAKGDFEVGALELLYERGIRPQILTGTSVGAINAAKLAEGEGGPDQGLAGLRAIWLGLRWNSDMWAPAAWLSTIDANLARAITNQSTPAFGGPTSYAAPGAAGWPGALAYGLANLIGGLSWLTSDGKVLLEAANAFMQARSVFQLQPIQQRIAGGALNESRVRAWGAAGGRLRLATVSLDSGALRYVTEAGTLVERDHITPIRVLRPTARSQQLRSEIDALVAEMRDLQGELRDAAPGAKGRLAGQIARLRARLQVLEAELLVEQGRSTMEPLQAGVGTGAIASSSIAVVFPPVKLGEEHYVDGGHRDTLPLNAALELGATQVYAVMASAPEIHPRDMKNARVMEIAERGLLEIHLDEILQNELRPPTDWAGRYHLIVPTVEVHNMLTIDPGLIRISMDYGYMRAADTLDGIDRFSPNGKALDGLVQLRLRQWVLECRLFGRPIPTLPDEDPEFPHPELEAEWRQVAAQVAAAIQARRAAQRTIPARAALWGKTSERHPWRVGAGGPVMAAARPNGEILFTAVSDDGGANGRVMYALVNAQGQLTGWQAMGLGYTDSNAWVSSTLVGNQSLVTWVGNDGWVYLQPLGADRVPGMLWPVGNSNNAPLQALPGSPVHGVSCKPGLLHVFYAARNGRVIYARRDTASGTWPEHAGLSGGVAAPGGHVTAVARAPGVLDVFCVGTSGEVFTAGWREGGAWSGWTPIPGVLGRPGQHVAAVSRSRDKIDLFLSDPQGRTMSAAFEPGAGWRSWRHIQGGMVVPGEPVTAVSRNTDQLDLFAHGRDGRVYTAAWSPQGGWGGWWLVSDARASGPVWAACRRTDQLDIIMVNHDRQPTHSSWPTPQGWSPARVIGEHWYLGE